MNSKETFPDTEFVQEHEKNRTVSELYKGKMESGTKKSELEKKSANDEEAE